MIFGCIYFMATRKKTKSSKKKQTSKRSFFRYLRYLPHIVLLGASALIAYSLHLDIQIRNQFEGKKWSLPARVFARPLELYTGQAITPQVVLSELESLQYQAVSQLAKPGSYRQEPGSITIYTRDFAFADGAEVSQRLRISFKGGTVVAIENIDEGLPRALIRLEPQIIASIYPAHNEDRILVKLDDVPRTLIEALITTEDRDFYNHWGVNPKAIARAIFVNLRAGRTVQGGSTLTQQLVKNYFLTNERTLSRKLNEAIMSYLLEYHYSKDQILEAYLNEIYLGQDGARGVHGIGLASLYYFGRTPSELSLAQQAMLVGIVKGPTYYDPRRHPQRAKQRRDLILKVMSNEGFITPQQAEQAQGQGLGVTETPRRGASRYPAFIDLVKRNLREYYDEDDLRSDGLRIFTTLDPHVQQMAEDTLNSELAEMERYYRVKKHLQGAIVVTHPSSGEVLAVVGDRQKGYAGYNRAVDAVRPIGSLIKPVIYLTALQQPDRYTLTTRVKDEPYKLEFKNGDIWEPQNYDHKSHGEILLMDGLANSYNLATVRIGMDIGVEQVIKNVRRLGVTRPLNIYPSLLLGAVEMTPMDVAQMYQTLANRGFHIPQRAIRAVLSADNQPLQSFHLDVQAAVDPASVYLINVGMQRVVSQGTAQGLYKKLPRSLNIAGKTGTTDDLKDSWFVGFTGNYLAVVWMGTDDNTSAGFSGSTGAMRIWGAMLGQLDAQPLMLLPDPGIEMPWVNGRTGQISQKGCDGAVKIPYIRGSAPTERDGCQLQQENKDGWLKRLFN